jgi:antitoxin MazE
VFAHGIGGDTPLRHGRLLTTSELGVSVDAGRVIIEPLPLADLSLDERLQRFDPARHSGEAMATTPLGAEKW